MELSREQVFRDAGCWLHLSYHISPCCSVPNWAGWCSRWLASPQTCTKHSGDALAEVENC